MSVSLDEVLTALLWSSIGAVVVWLLTWPLRRRSTGLLLLSLTLTCAAASAGAMLGAVHSMLLPMGDEPTVLTLAGVAGGLTAVVAVAAARRVSREHGAVRRAVDDLAHGLIPDTSGPRLSHELHALRAQLHSSAAALQESRERESALDASRRELVAWVSHDLRTPLAGLRAMAEALEDGVADEPGDVLQADRRCGRAAHRPGRRPLRPVPDPGRRARRPHRGALAPGRGVRPRRGAHTACVGARVPLDYRASYRRHRGPGQCR